MFRCVCVGWRSTASLRANYRPSQTGLVAMVHIFHYLRAMDVKIQNWQRKADVYKFCMKHLLIQINTKTDKRIHSFEVMQLRNKAVP